MLTCSNPSVGQEDAGGRLLYRCDVCSARFGPKEEGREHVAAAHLECAGCRITYAWAGDLRCHFLRKKHPDEVGHASL